MLAAGIAAVVSAAAPVFPALACGYESPDTISRGGLSWSYPDALYVMGAISEEIAAGRLPLANFDRPGIDLFGHKFLLAKNSLEAFGAMLGAASPEPMRTPVAVVLIEPMLWARFAPTADGLRTIVHVPNAEHGDLVIVTGEAVIAEIAARRLTFGEAYARGVARIYGADAQIAAFVQAYQQVGANQSTVQPAVVTGDAGNSPRADGEKFVSPRPYSPYAHGPTDPTVGVTDAARTAANLAPPVPAGKSTN
jgi:hypothetical protein